MFVCSSLFPPTPCFWRVVLFVCFMSSTFLQCQEILGSLFTLKGKPGKKKKKADGKLHAFGSGWDPPYGQVPANAKRSAFCGRCHPPHQIALFLSECLVHVIDKELSTFCSFVWSFFEPWPFHMIREGAPWTIPWLGWKREPPLNTATYSVD